MNNAEISNYRLKFSSSPHIHSKWNTKHAMYFVILSLVPCIVSAVWFFGVAQLSVLIVSVAFCLLTEYLIKIIRKQKSTLDDGSAIITGLLLGLILPPNFSLVSTAIGGIVAIGIGKEIFGGLGFNIFNPALVGRAFLQAAFPVDITTWIIPDEAVDSVSGATPLAAFKFDKVITASENLFWGNVGGSIGETSAFAIIIGGLFLIVMRVVNWRIPVSTLLGLVVLSSIFWSMDPIKYPNPLFQILSGGFLFGAFFMATDWVTSPLTKKGMWIFGFGISFLVVMIRLFGGLPEGVMYSILLMNAFVPLINKLLSK